MSFIGRGEYRAFEILERLFPHAEVTTQIPIQRFISTEDFRELGPSHSKHKCDIVISRPELEPIIVEVNYKHGSIANKKWKVYRSLLEKSGCDTVTIDDSECESLFSLEDEKNPRSHRNTWQDWIDVINALDKAGISE